MMTYKKNKNEKYNNIWDKVNVDIEKELDSESVYNKEFLKTKIKSHGEKLQIFTIKKLSRWTLIILV